MSESAADMPAWYQPPAHRGDGILTYRLDLSLPGRPRRAEFTVPDQPIRLADVVGLAHRLSTRLAIDHQQRLTDAGRPVRCRRACAACCRYLVPITAAEPICLAETVESQVPELKEVLCFRFRRASHALARAAEGKLSRDLAPDELADLAESYAALSQPCPLLSGELCMHYEHRPLACREHATSEPSWRCGLPGGASPMVMPVSVTEAMIAVGATLEPGAGQVVLLPQLLDWWEHNRVRGQRHWPADRVWGLLVGQLSLLVRRAAAEAGSADRVAG